MSGFLSSALGSLMGGGTTNQNGVSQAGAGGLLSEAFNAAGGVQGIMSRFQQAGMGDKVQSWAGNGSNASLSPSELTQVFPPQQIENWAQRYGVPSGVATELLSHLLPHAVDSQTQDGQAMANQNPFADGSGQAPAATTPEPDSQGSGQGNAGGFDFGGLVQRLMGGH